MELVSGIPSVHYLSNGGSLDIPLYIIHQQAGPWIFLYKLFGIGPWISLCILFMDSPLWYTGREEDEKVESHKYWARIERDVTVLTGALHVSITE